MLNFLLRFPNESLELRKYICSEMVRETLLNDIDHAKAYDITKFEVPSSFPPIKELHSFLDIDGFMMYDVMSRECGIFVAMNRRQWLVFLEVAFNFTSKSFTDSQDLKLLVG